MARPGASVRQWLIILPLAGLLAAGAGYWGNSEAALLARVYSGAYTFFGIVFFAGIGVAAFNGVSGFRIAISGMITAGLATAFMLLAILAAQPDAVLPVWQSALAIILGGVIGGVFTILAVPVVSLFKNLLWS